MWVVRGFDEDCDMTFSCDEKSEKAGKGSRLFIHGLPRSEESMTKLGTT